jgi:hypothetical protein
MDAQAIVRSLPVRAATKANPKKQRSRVTNGRSPFVEADGRGPWARRWSDILAEIIGDLGGHQNGLAEGQRQLARRCATLSINCERMEGEIAAGNDVDLEQYGRMSDRLGRNLQRLGGLQRQPRDVTPTLEQYVAAKRAREATS